jgi:hypothetical protein
MSKISQLVITMSIRKYFLGLCFLSLFLNSEACLGQENPAIPKHRILVYGEPTHDGELTENLVGQKWGIEFYRVAGCTVTQELLDSVKQHNDAVETSLSIKYGLDWKRRFNEDLKAEREKQNQIIENLKKLDFIEVKQREMEKKDGHLYYLITPILNTSKYNVVVAGWHDSKVEYLGKVYDLVVDFPGMAVTILD